MLIHHLLPSPRHSHTFSSISSFWVGKTGQSQDKAEPGRDPNTRRKRGAPGACARDREREGKRWCSWTCSSTTAADDGCTRRTTPSSEFEARKTTSRERKREREREAERRGVTGRYALRSSAPTREDRERNRKRLIDRRTDHCLLNVLTSSVLLCILQRGRGKDEVIVQAFSVPSFGF